MSTFTSLADIIQNVDESKQKIAVLRAIAGMLRTRYLSRDGLPAQATIAYERSTVTAEVIELVIYETEAAADKLQKEVDATLQGPLK